VNHTAALAKINTLQGLSQYLAKYPDDKATLIPLLTARKNEINAQNV